MWSVKVHHCLIWGCFFFRNEQLFSLRRYSLACEETMVTTLRGYGLNMLIVTFWFAGVLWWLAARTSQSPWGKREKTVVVGLVGEDQSGWLTFRHTLELFCRQHLGHPEMRWNTNRRSWELRRYFEVNCIKLPSQFEYPVVSLNTWNN